MENNFKRNQRYFSFYIYASFQILMHLKIYVSFEHNNYNESLSSNRSCLKAVGSNLRNMSNSLKMKQIYKPSWVQNSSFNLKTGFSIFLWNEWLFLYFNRQKLNTNWRRKDLWSWRETDDITKHCRSGGEYGGNAVTIVCIIHTPKCIKMCLISKAR